MSLHDHALLVNLSLTTIPTARKDRQITDGVLRDHHAAPDAGRWVSRLWPKEALDPIRKLDSQIRAYHAEKTLPWSNRGERIIAARTTPDYFARIRSFRAERDKLIADFAGNYDFWITRAASMRGNAFRPDEYPPAHTVQRRMRFTVESAPIPHRDDFRIQLAAGPLDGMRHDLEARIEAATQAARAELYQRVAEPVSRLIERIADGTPLTAKTFNALRALVKDLPDANAIGDPNLDLILRTIDAQILRLDPEAINTSKSDRSRAVMKANGILAAMAPWMAPLEDEDEDEESIPARKAV